MLAMAGQVLQLIAAVPRVLERPAVEAPISLAERVAAVAVGRLVEISGQGDTAGLTLAVDIVRQVQAEGETAAWVQPAGGPLFPPDLHDACVDLESLIVIHVPAGAGAYGVPRAAELLLRSGGFGLVVLDLTEPAPAAPVPPVISSALPVISSAERNLQARNDVRRSLPLIEMTKH
jgi:RecA/RadA recombinase